MSAGGEEAVRQSEMSARQQPFQGNSHFVIELWKTTFVTMRAANDQAHATSALTPITIASNPKPISTTPEMRDTQRAKLSGRR